MVNPHESFILGTNDIETPAEIDGLLDHYFASRHTSEVMSSDDSPGQQSSSQQSSSPVYNVSRQGRVLYDDPESARRTIMRLRGASARSAGDNSNDHESPLADRGYEANVTLSDSRPSAMTAPPTPPNFPDESEGLNGLRNHRSIREALGLGVTHTRNDREGEQDLGLLEAGYVATGTGVDDSSGDLTNMMGNLSMSKSARPQHSLLADTVTGPAPSRADRGTSVYPQSQRSDPFDLAVSENGDSDRNRHNNIDQVVTAGRSSYYARSGALDDREDDFAVYEDPNVANAYVPSSCRSRLKNALTRCFIEQVPKHPRARLHRR